MRFYIFFVVVVGSVACNHPKPVFEKLSAGETGIDFTNTITEDTAHNVFTYQYYYNGNGVAVGDVNNDGLTDLFLPVIKRLPSSLSIKATFILKILPDKQEWQEKMPGVPEPTW